MIIGSGIPNNHNSAPLPKPMALTPLFSRERNAWDLKRFLKNAGGSTWVQVQKLGFSLRKLRTITRNCDRDFRLFP
jgi:hypothetical protein